MKEQPDIMRIPPQSIDSEKAVLGSMLQDKDAVFVGLEILEMDHFYTTAHQYIFGAMKELSLKNIPVDQLSVTEKMLELKILDDAGGPAYLADLINRVPTSSNIKFYAEKVREKWSMRMVLAETFDIQDAIYNGKLEGEDGALPALDSSITRLINSRSKTETNELKKIDMFKAIEYAEDLAKDPDEAGVVFTGIKAIDEQVKGFRPKELYIYAGRPGMGKTGLGLSMARNICKNYGKSVGFFSLEMSEEEISLRLLSAESGVHHTILSDGGIQAHHYDKINPAAERISRYNLYIDDSAGITPANIISRSRLLISKHNLDILFVDYLQIMSSGSKYDSRNDEVGKISAGLAGIAKQLHIPVVALAQLNRGVETRGDKRPTMSDLRDSGAIEQDANMVTFIYRDGYYNRDADKYLTELITAKFRRGPTGKKNINFMYDVMDFRDIDFVHSPEPHDDFVPHEGEGVW
jgi:replicative DNA helicase